MDIVLKKLNEGIVLMSIGIILLFNVTGFIDWGIWLFYLNFWPIILIFAGFRLVLSIVKSFQTIIIIFQIILWLLIIFGGVVYYKSHSYNGYSLSAKEYYYALSTDNNINVPVAYDLNFSFGDYDISDTDNSTYDAIVVDGKYSESFGLPIVTSLVTENEIKYSFKQEKEFFVLNGFINTPNNFKIVLGRKNISDMQIDLGAGKLTSKLANVKIENLDINIGAGESLIEFANEVEVGNMNIKVGAGKITLVLDKSYRYSIDYNVGAGSINVENKSVGGLASRGNTTNISANTDSKKVLSINIDIGAGEFVLDYDS